MGIKIKKGFNPVGTEHYASMPSGPTSITAYYMVIGVTGTATNAPNQDDPVVYLRLNRKIARPVDTFISLPLSVFVSAFEQTSEGDVFWEDGKSLQA